MPICLSNCSFHVNLNSKRNLLLCPTRHVRFRSLTVQSSGIISSDPAMASNSVRVAAAQMTSINDLAANFATCSRLVKEAVAAEAKLVCFPESFSFIAAKNGESVKLAEPLDGPIMQRYCSLARESGIWLSLGGFQEKGSDDAHLRNTHVIIDDSGNIRSSYSKIHLFDVDVPGGRVYKESSFTEPGKDIVAVDSPVGRLGLSVCYDLRFPELYQQLRFQHEAQILLVPSAFTTITGQAHWEILLRARAIETQCYVIAAAQAGKHNENRESYGDTLIIDPWGTVVGRLPDRISTGITVADIDFSLIDSVRAKIPIAKQRKPYRVLDICISVIVQSRKPPMDEQPTRKEHQKGKINKSPSLLGKASCLPPVLFCPDNGPPPSLHQTLVVAYDSRNDDLSSYFHIKDGKSF
ncbi:DEAMINATED GLUTATHIONE AMIDASE [Salix koriyanagi]|uniref:DEAMINATED GLUTATHIONE AMIDASE n=1 Tax=Salix koriyanagi TaxID=2511006 RepID=A0A9Q0WIT6_9ROSI|nr:DEAMINATED GLUTATHIONE AMIDASE [Salix koriyanagi]